MGGEVEEGSWALPVVTQLVGQEVCVVDDKCFLLIFLLFRHHQRPPFWDCPRQKASKQVLGRNSDPPTATSGNLLLGHPVAPLLLAGGCPLADWPAGLVRLSSIKNNLWKPIICAVASSS